MAGHKQNPYRGVSWDARTRKYRVKIHINDGHKRRHVWLGRYEDPKVGARVYDVAAVYLLWPDAVLNFDGRSPPSIPRAKIKQTLIEKGLGHLLRAWPGPKMMNHE